MEENNRNLVNDNEFSSVDLSGTLSSVRLSEDVEKKSITENLTADKLLDELPLPQQHSAYIQTTIDTPKSNYDQFFEEVSLDLPRDSFQENNNMNGASSRLMKFMPRRGNTSSIIDNNNNNNSDSSNINNNNNNNNSSNNSNNKNNSNKRISVNHSLNNTTNYHDDTMMISPSDVSGPFYSISDVLDDSQPSNQNSKQSNLSTDINQNQIHPGAARRNVNEADVIVTSGGTSMPIKGRSSLNIFRKSKVINQKPTPLETVISKTRPRMLPPKNPQEEKRHLQEYEAMMKKAKKLEEKKQKENDRKKELKDRRLNHALYIWEKDIIPNWKTKLNDTRTVVLWNQGIPPRCRKNVWALRIGNPLEITKTTMAECVRRLPQSVRSSPSTTNLNNDSVYPASFDSQQAYTHYIDNKTAKASVYKGQRQRRTSSLDVLRENKEDQQPNIEYEDDQESHVTPEKSLSDHSQISTNQDSYPVDDSTGERSTIELESNGIYMDEYGSIGLEDDDEDEEEESSQDEVIDDGLVDDKIITDPAAINYLNKAIDEDILRTLPSLCVFQPDGPLFASLRKVLHAYVGYRSNMTYPRGASFLAGVLLLNMNSQNTFASLVNLIHRSQVLTALYNADEKKIQGYFKIFNVIFAENLPKLYLHFKNLTLTPDHYLLDWFMTIFSSIIPLELSSRLWDIYLLHGDIIFFRTGLVVLKYLEPLLWGGGFSDTVKVLNMGFVGEHRGEEVKAALAVSGHITEGDDDPFFDEILGRKGIHLDRARFKDLLGAHMPRSA